MDLTARAPALAGRQVPFRSLAVVALLALAIGVAATVYFGSQRRVPAPYGPARNGLIVYVVPDDPSWATQPGGDYTRPLGDILTVDPATGDSSVLVGGPTLDGYPVVSLDGTRVAFTRETEAGQQLYAVDLAGGDLVGLTDEPLPEIDDAAWSPDGTSLAFTARDGDRASLWIARSDGGGADRVELGSDLSVALPQWRPPGGDELLLVGSTDPSPGFLPGFGYRDLWGGSDRTGSGIGLYVVNADGSRLRPITPGGGTGVDFGIVSWAPAGDRILTQTAGPAGYLRIRVLSADGAEVETIEPTTGNGTVSPMISPDGQRIAYADLREPDGEWTLRVQPIDGDSTPVETGATFVGGAAAFRWSPDGESLIVTHHFFKETWLFDADGGPGTRVGWIDPGSNAWQRLAP